MEEIEIIEETPLSLSEVKKLIKKKEKEGEEPNFRMARTLEYISFFKEINEKKSEELKKKITSLNIPRMKEDILVKILDILPKSTDELKMIMQGHTLTISKENMEKIVKAVKEVYK